MATEKRSVDRKVVDVERNSPALIYDAVTTRVFPKLKHDRLALKLNGKDDNLRRADSAELACERRSRERADIARFAGQGKELLLLPGPKQSWHN